MGGSAVRPDLRLGSLPQSVDLTAHLALVNLVLQLAANLGLQFLVVGLRSCVGALGDADDVEAGLRLLHRDLTRLQGQDSRLQVLRENLTRLVADAGAVAGLTVSHAEFGRELREVVALSCPGGEL